MLAVLLFAMLLLHFVEPTVEVKSMKHLVELAEQGDVDSQCTLGSRLHDGEGVATNTRKAMFWWSQAANQRHAESQFKLANLLKKGSDDVTKNVTDALKWLRKAAEQGHLRAQFNLGKLLKNGGDGVPKNARAAQKWWTEAAKSGLADAQFQLWKLLRTGGEGVTKDPKEAQEWYVEAAKRSYPGTRLADAQFKLGLLLSDGTDGVAKDAPAAKEWYTKAAKQGHVKAQYNLGLMLRRGADGVATDAWGAVDWWTKAAGQQHAKAQYNLGNLFRSGTKGMHKKPAKAVEWYTKAAKQGFREAQYNLGLMLHHGAEGVAKDVQAAEKWWVMAALQEHARALLQLSVLGKDPTLVETASHDYTAVHFKDSADLDRGDAIVAYSQDWWGMTWTQHWAIYDKHDDTMIDLSQNTTTGEAIIRSYPFREWLGIWSRGWLWPHPVEKVRWKDRTKFEGRDVAVNRARALIGTQGIKYSTLPTLGGRTTMNCESFVRWCLSDVARVASGELFGS